MATKHFMTSLFSNSSGDYAGGHDDQTSRTCSSSNPSLRQNYEVFLSFNGDDTRHGFTDHLYLGLVNRGIKVFRDSENLHEGQKIDQLLETIMTSKILVPIISTGYASSQWCLKELVQILECNKQSAQLILPIFYKVEPSDVKNQKNQFGKKFLCFKEKYSQDIKLVQESEQAFKEIVSFKGWESDKFADRHEGQLVKAVVTRIFNELRKQILDVPEFLVGVEVHVKEIMKMVCDKQSNDAKIIAIHGMGGIGKTTLAKVLYNELFDHFDGHSFVPNVREASSTYKGMVDLQKQVVSNILADKSLQEISHVDEGINIIEKSFKGKRLLLLLDDVDDKDKLNKLGVKNNWLGSECIVIITTRNKDITEASAINLSYELNKLDRDQSYELFCKHAFRGDASCPSNLENIAKDIVSMTGGLPLAIEIIGSMLYRRKEDFWSATSKKLRTIPNDKVMARLMLSYDALQHEQQQIFLDIACLSIRYRYKRAFYMWDACDLYPEDAIETLVSLSLIKVRDEEIAIHDQLRDLGREIVRREGRDNTRICSRLQLKGDEIEVIKGKQGASNVQALDLRPDGICLTSQHFEGMTNLRFLRCFGEQLTGDFENHFSNIIWFRWDSWGYGNGDIRRFSFNPRKLVILELYFTNITEHWTVWNQVKNLKVLSIKHNNHMTATPDFSAVEGLEELVLVKCYSLKKIHPSVGKFRKTLKVLDFSHCRELEYIPEAIGKLDSLTHLDLSWTGVTELPVSIGDLYNLELLGIRNIPIKRLPASIERLSKLEELDVERSKELEFLPNLPCGLTSLLFDGHSMETLPDISNLTNLKHLKYKDVFERRNRVLDLTKLNQLETLMIIYSKWNHKKMIPETFEGIIFERTKIDKASEDINFFLELPLGLKKLAIYGCPTLRTFPDLSNMKDLSRLILEDCSELNCLELEGAKTLTYLCIKSCRKLSKLGGIGTMVMDLRLKSLDKLQSLSNLSTSKELKNLEINNCSNLVEVQGFEDVVGLETLEIKMCPLLKRTTNLSHLKDLSRLTLEDCSEINCLELEGAETLRCLCIRRCRKLSELNGVGTMVTDLILESLDALRSLSNLSTSKKLKNLEISNCSNLVEVQALEDVVGLETLKIKMCPSLERIANFSRLKDLFLLTLEDCSEINCLELEGAETLRFLCIRRCRKLSELSGAGTMATNLILESLDALQRLSNLSTSKKLKNLEISNCSNLVEVQALEDVVGLKTLKIKMCPSLERIANFSRLKDLFLLTLEDCSEINCLELEGAETLRFLCIRRCRKLSELSGVRTMVTDLILESLDALRSLSNLSTSKKLKNLEISNCSNLVEVQGLENVVGLETLKIKMCPFLERIANFSYSKMLTTLELRDCEKPSNVQGIEKLTSLSEQCISKPLQDSLDLSQSTNLQKLEIIPRSVSDSDELGEGEESQSDFTPPKGIRPRSGSNSDELGEGEESQSYFTPPEGISPRSGSNSDELEEGEESQSYFTPLEGISSRSESNSDELEWNV